MPNFYDEMYSTAATVRSHYCGFADWLALQPPRSDRPETGRSRAHLPARGDHLRRVWRQRRQGAADPVRHHSARDQCRRVGPAASGPGPARHRAEQVPARCLPRPEHPEGGHHPARTDRAERAVPAGDARRRRAGRHLCPHRRGRHRARRRGRVLRARRQPAGAVRRLLHAGKPQDDDAAVPRAVRAQPGGAGRALSRPAARQPAHGGAAGHQPIRPSS